MKRALWWLRRHAVVLALWGGLLLIGLATSMQWLVIRPLEQQLAADEQADARQGRRPALALDPGNDPRTQLATFYATFERADKLTGSLGKLHALGRAKGLELKRAEYRLSSPTEGRLDRYQVVMPLRGSYKALRAFIAAALRELPTMTLDQVQFQRQEVGEAMVDAQLTLTFHLAR